MLWEKLKAAHRKRIGESAKTVKTGKNGVIPEKTVWIIAGLGNFGPEYAETRHNCGFRALDRLAEKLAADNRKHRFKGVTAEAEYENNKLILLWPYTYMNASGESISEALKWYKVPPERLIVIYDDSDLDAGALRIRGRGSAGTHNGMKSVLSYTETEFFPRVRIGIGRKPVLFDMKDFVLGKLSDEEKPLIDGAERSAADAVLSIVSKGCEKTMSAFNSPHSSAHGEAGPGAGGQQDQKQ